MGRFLVLGILMTFHAFCFGQSTFFNFVEGWVNNYSTETNDSYLTLGLNSLDAGPSNHSLQYNTIGFEGELVIENSFLIDSVATTTTYGMSQMAVRVDNFIYRAALFGFASPIRYYGALFRYDLETQATVLLHVYDESLINHMYSIASKNDSTLLIGGYHSNNFGTTALVLHETDLQGAPRWTYTTECGNSCYNYAEHILPLENGNTVLLYREWDYEIGNQDKERAVLVMIDTAGVELWRVYPGNDEDYKILPGGVVLQDDQLLVCFTDPYVYEANGDWVYSYENTVQLERYNLNGGFISNHSFIEEILNSLDIPRTTYEVSQLQYLADGNILISGTTGPGGLLMKVDPDGGLIWFREILQHPLAPLDEGYNQDLDILHVLETSDGGLLCTGMFHNTPSVYFPQGIQTAIALKVDEYGCLEQGCEVVGIDELQQGIDEGQFNIFPNPAETTLNISSAEETIISEWQLMDLSGKIIAQESGLKAQALNIDVTEMDQGLYLIQVTDSDGNTAVKKFVKR